MSSPAFPRILRAAAIIGVLFSACEDVGDELPSGWADARRLQLRQSSCGGDPYTSGPRPRLELSASGGALQGSFKDAQFRCGDQELCGFALDRGAVTQVLVQPCNLHPMNVPRCDCLYEVTFTLPARPVREMVELYSRRDLYGAQAPVAPALVDVEPMP
jgi:hypothetical protein